MEIEHKKMTSYANVILGHLEDDGSARSFATFNRQGIDYKINFMIPPNDMEVYCLDRLFINCGFTRMRLSKDRGTAQIYKV